MMSVLIRFHFDHVKQLFLIYLYLYFTGPIGDLSMTFEPSWQAPSDGTVPVFDVGAQATMQCRGDVGQEQNDIRWCVKEVPNSFSYVEKQRGGTTYTQSVGVGASCGGWIGQSTLKYNISKQDSLTSDIILVLW